MVYILLAPGFEEAEALVPADLLRRAGVDVSLVSLQGDAVTGSHQITVKADLTLERVNLDDAEMLVLPGGGLGVKHLGEAPEVEALVRQAVARGLWWGLSVPRLPSWGAGDSWRGERPSASLAWKDSWPARRCGWSRGR